MEQRSSTICKDRLCVNEEEIRVDICLMLNFCHARKGSSKDSSGKCLFLSIYGYW